MKAVLDTRCEPNASILVEHTRWSPHDAVGLCLEDDANDWKLLRYPALAEEDDILGRPIGAALCPERFTVEDLEKKKRSMGSQLFAGLYQQRPSAIEGAIIKREWLRYYDEPPAAFDEIGSFWDLAFGASDTSSYCAGQIWGRVGSSFYLIDQLRGRWEFPQMVQAVVAMSAKYPAVISKYVEAAAAGKPLIATLAGSIPGLIGETVTDSKPIRMASVAGLFEAGNVYLPSERLCPWVSDYVEELTTFPNANNDDQADTTSMALKKLSVAEYDFNFALPGSGQRVSPWSDLNA
jgi:predicted phage terminase large subunit-like protein